MYEAKTNDFILTDSSLIASASAESNALTFGTTANWMNVVAWQKAVKANQVGSPDNPKNLMSLREFDIEIACDAAETLTSPQLFGWRPIPVTIADDDVNTVDFANNELDLTSHVYETGDGPVQLTTTDTLPTGLATGTDYYVRDLGANSISLHTTRAGAVANTGQVTFSDGGTGTHTIVDVQSSNNSDNDTKRLHGFLYGDLNAAATITVGAKQAYIERIQHSPATLYYEIVATSGTGAQTLAMRCVPVQTVEW